MPWKKLPTPDESCDRILTHYPAAGPRAPDLLCVINYLFNGRHFIFSGPQGDPLNPAVLTLEEAILRFGRGKRNGRRVVFTNGCFDLLHPGHIRSLELARALGDVLIVGLNSDASVRLESVDAVVIFDDLTPREVIAGLLPDVLVKGGDWPGDRIVGREEVEAAGGRVVSIPVVPGYSTTAILRKIREGARASRAES